MTARRGQILEYVAWHQQEHGRGPTIPEITRGIGRGLGKTAIYRTI